MRNCITGAIVYALLLGAAFAGPTVIITDSGTYVMTVGADGVPVTARADEVLDKRTGAPPPNPGPGPTPPPDEPPTSVTARVKEIADETRDPETAQLIGYMYRGIADIKTGERAQYLNAMKEATDSVLRMRSKTESLAWKAARNKLSALITEKEAAGSVNWPVLVGEIAAGFEQATGSQPAIPPELLNILIELIRSIILRIFGL